MSWEKKPLQTIADFCLGKMLDQKKNKGDLLPYLANVNVRWGSFELDDLREMRFEHHELNRFGLKNGDIVVCEGGEPGRCAIWKEQKPNMMFQKALHRIRPHECLSNEFLFYSLLYKGRTGRLAPLFTGATIKHLPREKLAKVEIEVPPLPVQHRIASILSAYDNLIENNRRRIQLLEQAARLLYKEWFVHLRFPGHEHAKIKDGVPEGWTEGVVADFYSTGSGGTPSRKNPDFYTGEIPWVKTQELTGCFIRSTDERITEEAVKRSSAKLFPVHTVLIAMYGATIGQTAVLSVPSTTNQACCAIIPKKSGTSYVHAYLFFCHHKTDLVGLGQGAAQNNISQQVIKSFNMVLPRKKLLVAFSDTVSPLFDQIEILQRNNINLVKARDILLPRLMNGEINV